MQTQNPLTNPLSKQNSVAPPTGAVTVASSVVPYVPGQDHGDEGETSGQNFSYRLMDPERIGYITPQPKEVKVKNQDTGKDETIKYNETKLNYRYENETTSFDEEWDEAIEATGITDGKGNKASIMVRFKDNQNLIKHLDEVYNKCARIVDQVKGPIGRHTFLVDRPESCGFSPIAFYKLDAGKRIEGSKPTLWMKLLNGRTKTLFVDPRGTPIDWKFLRNVELVLMPRVRYSHIFSNGTLIKVTVILREAIVTSIQRVNAESSQKFSLARFQRQNPSATKSFDEQLSKLKIAMERDTKMDLPSGPPSGPPQKKEDNKPDESKDKKKADVQPSPSMAPTSLPSGPGYYQPTYGMNQGLPQPGNPQQFNIHQQQYPQMPTMPQMPPQQPQHQMPPQHQQYPGYPPNMAPPHQQHQPQLGYNNFNAPSNTLS